MALKKRNILILPIIIIIAFVGYFTYKKCTEYLEKLEHEINQKSLEYSLIKQEIDDNKVYEEKWDSIKSFMNELPGDRMNNYGDFLINLETERNFDLQSTPEEVPIPANEEMQEIVFKLQFTSTITDLAEFLGRLDSEQNKLLQIKSMTVNYHGKSFRPGYSTIDKNEDKELVVDLVLATPAKAVESEENDIKYGGTLLP